MQERYLHDLLQPRPSPWRGNGFGRDASRASLVQEGEDESSKGLADLSVKGGKARSRCGAGVCGIVGAQTLFVWPGLAGNNAWALCTALTAQNTLPECSFASTCICVPVCAAASHACFPSHPSTHPAAARGL